MGFLSSIGSFLTGGGSSLVRPALSFLGGERSNAASAKAADRQMDFQREMYSSRYQMQMEDMKKAGLNPILSYGQAPPGSPSGSSYTAADSLSPAVNSAMASQRLSEELKNMRETNKKIQSETELNQALKKRASVDAALSATQLPKSAALGQLYNDVPWLAKASGFAGDMGHIVNSLVQGAFGVGAGVRAFKR